MNFIQIVLLAFPFFDQRHRSSRQGGKLTMTDRSMVLPEWEEHPRARQFRKAASGDTFQYFINRP